jgi:hypothetical protein
MLIAYADGELDLMQAKRVERAVADDPALGERIAAHQRLRERISETFAPIAFEPVPDRLTALLAGNVVAFAPRRPRVNPWWPAAGAMAAALTLAVGLAAPWSHPPRSGDLASGALNNALTRRLAASDGDPRLLVSFRDGVGTYCRAFSGRNAAGIACRKAEGWRLVRVASGATQANTTYRQAGSSDAATLAAAQAMMVGEPLDAQAEARARRSGWR